MGGLRHLTGHPPGTSVLPPPRCGLSISDEQLKEVPFIRFPEGSAEAEYLRAMQAFLAELTQPN